MSTNKAYIHKESGELVTSIRNHVPAHVVCECPRDRDGNYVTDLECVEMYTCEETGAVKAKANQAKIDQKKHEAEERRRKEEERKKQIEQAKEEVSYSGISQEELMKAKSFDEIKKYISYLMKINGID